MRHLKNHPWVERGKDMIAENILAIYDKQKEYQAKAVRSIDWFVKRFNLNF